MQIKEQLKRLIELQAIDTQMYQHHFLEQQEIPQRLKKLDDELLQTKKQLLQSEERLKRLHLEKKNKELDLQTKENNVKKFQIQLFQVKTNKEYASLEKEIEGLKADNSLLEEEIIHLLDELDAVAELVRNDKKRFEEESKRIQEERKKSEQELEQLRQKLKELEGVRNAVIQQADPLILPRYESVLRLRHGSAVVPVKEGACQGCFMNLPPQVINMIYAAEDWVACEQCARILYVENEESRKE